jgi:hypothetical protein
MRTYHRLIIAKQMFVSTENWLGLITLEPLSVTLKIQDKWHLCATDFYEIPATL